MKPNITVATAIAIHVIIQLAAIVALAVYAPLWIAIPLIVLMIAA